MRNMLIACLLSAGCFDYQIPQPGPKAPVHGVDATDVQGEPGPAPASCPTLVYGVVRCQDLAPECAQPGDPNVEAGLHCIPGYEDDPTVPCFCVGATTSDSWCVREAQ